MMFLVKVQMALNDIVACVVLLYLIQAPNVQCSPAQLLEKKKKTKSLRRFNALQAYEGVFVRLH